jgi:predicted acylesterase/phospholipase RssA
VILGATDLNTGSIIVLDYDDLNEDEYVSAIIGSSSLPVLFPFRKLRGHYLIDGGVSWNLNMVSAFKKCMAMVDNDPSRIILDVIVMFENDFKIEESNKDLNSI